MHSSRRIILVYYLLKAFRLYPVMRMHRASSMRLSEQKATSGNVTKTISDRKRKAAKKRERQNLSSLLFLLFLSLSLDFFMAHLILR